MKKYCNRALILAICVWMLTVTVSAAKMLVPVGQVVGLELKNETVTVAAFDQKLSAEAEKAGLKVGDKILKVNGQAVHSVTDVRNALDKSDGTVQLLVRRGQKTETLQLQPAITPEGPRLGVYLKQGITGVGTVTWYDPATGKFGTLGHGVNDGNNLLQMTGGSAYEASVVSVRRGVIGKPGQLMGAIQDSQPLGTLYKNTEQGVFGTNRIGWEGEALPTGQAKAGKAIIRSTVSGNTVQEYSVEILKVYPKAGVSGRNILLRITDPALLEITGGIVQGMSGSPIIQDGKLVGAVTHVLINDPTMGYGIFIDNMLNAAA